MARVERLGQARELHAGRQGDVVALLAVVAVAAHAALGRGEVAHRQAHHRQGQIHHRRQHKGPLRARLQEVVDVKAQLHGVAVGQQQGVRQVAPVQLPLAFVARARQQPAHKVALCVGLQLAHVGTHARRLGALELHAQVPAGAAIGGHPHRGVHALHRLCGGACGNAAQRVLRAHVHHRLGVGIGRQVAERNLLGRRIHIHLPVGQVVDHMVGAGHHRQARQVVGIACVDEHLLTADARRPQQRLQQGGVVLAVAHSVLEHGVGVARHHGPYANAVATVGDVGGHPFVQQAGALARLLHGAHDALRQRAHAFGGFGLGQRTLAVGAGDGGVVGKGAGQQHWGFFQAPDALISLVPGAWLGVAVAPLAHAELALLCAGLLVQTMGLKAQGQPLGRTHGDAAVGVHHERREAVRHRERAREDGLLVLDAVLDGHRVAHGQVREHHRDARAVREKRLAALVAIAGLGLEVVGRHIDAPPVLLEGVGLEHLALLDTVAEPDAVGLEVFQRPRLQHLVVQFLRHGGAPVRPQVVAHMPALQRRRCLGTGSRCGRRRLRPCGQRHGKRQPPGPCCARKGRGETKHTKHPGVSVSIAAPAPTRGRRW